MNQAELRPKPGLGPRPPVSTFDPSAKLLPDAPSNIYEGIIAKEQFVESMVNGIWNSILSTFFPINAMQYILSPEVNSKDGRPDIFVVRTDLSKQWGVSTVWTLIFEGKKGEGETFPAILDQLTGYTTSLRTKQQVYLLGARGRTCAFWRYTQGVADDVTYEQISVDTNTGDLRFEYDTTAVVLDIEGDQAQIAAILSFIAKNPLPIPVTGL